MGEQGVSELLSSNLLNSGGEQDTGVNINLTSFLASGNTLWLQTQKVGEDAVFAAVVPEPASAAMFGLGALFVLGRRHSA